MYELHALSPRFRYECRILRQRRSPVLRPLGLKRGKEERTVPALMRCCCKLRGEYCAQLRKQTSTPDYRLTNSGADSLGT